MTSTLHVPPPGVTVETHAAALCYAAATTLHAAQLCLAHSSRPNEQRSTIEDIGAHRQGVEALAMTIRLGGSCRKN